MKPEEKANEIFIKFLHALTDNSDCAVSKAYAKDCALICVQEIINENQDLYWNRYITLEPFKLRQSYYRRVKQHLEN